jgi:polar amino acid transport system substrate-binding protein
LRRLFYLMRIATVLCCAVMCVLIMPGQAHAKAGGRLLVGVFESAPFAFKDDLGKWNGITVDLWEAVAKEKGFNFDYVEVKEKDAVNRLAKGEIDVIAAGLPISAESEVLIDYSEPFYSSDWSIAVIRRPVVTLESALGHVFGSWQLWAFVICIGLAFVLVAIAMWNVEVRENPEYSGPTKLHGIAYGLYWSVAMMTGAGEKAPRTLPGRIIAMGWLAAAFLLTGVFTASLTTVLSVEHLSRKISSERDLPQAYVAVMPGYCETLMNQMNVRYALCSDEKECLAMLEKGQVDAVVAGEPFLKYYSAKGYKGKLDIMPMDYDEVFYAIGLGPNSEITEEVNRGVLNVISTHAWAGILRRYLNNL